MRKIEINWSYPMEIDSILNDERMGDIGLYYITRNFGGNISDSNIDKTTYSYKSRLESHWWYWLENYRGRKYVRLGTIIRPRHISEEKLKQLINDAETTLIFCCRNQLIHNAMCMNPCSATQRLHIFNTGRIGNLPSELYIPDEEWVWHE